MVDFRRLLFALVLLSIVGLTVSTANAQILSCTATAVPARIRGEDRTALVGDVLLGCSGTAGGTITANIQVFLGANVTSRITKADVTPKLTEALLAVGEPAPTAQILAPLAGANVYQAGLVGDNSLLWSNVSIPVVPAPGTTLRMTNVRVNARQAFGEGAQTFIPQQITMTITVTSTAAIPVTNATLVVGNVLKGLTFALRNCADDDSASTSFAQCSKKGKTDPTSTDHDLQGLLKFSEGFDASFRTQIVSGQDGAVLGTITNVSESAYMNSNRFLTTLIGSATSGTRLIARFTNVPAGVSIFVTTRQVFTGTTSGTEAVLVNVGDPTGIGGSTLTPIPGTATLDKAACTDSSDDGKTILVQVPIFGGVGSAAWEIKETNVTAIEDVSFGYEVAYAAKPAENLPALTGATPGTVSGNFAPVSDIDKASATAPIPRFADLPQTKDVIKVSPCMTNLLLPFVTARLGFDTGIAITNTTLDNSKDLPGGKDKEPFKTPSQSGACTLYYFGDNADGTSLAKPIQTSSVIQAGKQLIYTVMAGGMGIDGTPGFQGYIIATCNFQLAHGFVFVSDLGARNFAMGYLPLVIPKDFGSDRTGTEALDN